MSKAYLVLANGRVFEGQRFGAALSAPVVGELVFNTGVVGYIELLTDPASFGQIILGTFPYIGNYGWIPADAGEKCYARAVAVREWCPEPSNFRAEGTIDAYLAAQGVVGICGIDTREIAQIIRDEGSMPACIVGDPADAPADLASFRVTGAVEAVCGGKTYTVSAEKPVCKVTVLDCGSGRALADALAAKGCDVTVVPYDTPAADILAAKPDGAAISDGPGDPRDNAGLLAAAKELCGKLPLLGVGLGHQLLALALGGSVEKLVHGHHGSNQPVREAATGRTLITTQNHGFAVRADSLAGKAEVILSSSFDGSCEGLRCKDIPALSVQFDPSVCAAGLLCEFITMMGGDR